MTNREKWLAALARDERVKDEHIYSIRFLAFLRSIATRIAKDPNYEPPDYESTNTMKGLAPIVFF